MVYKENKLCAENSTRAFHFNRKNSVSCNTSKVARSSERATNNTFLLSEGITFARNEYPIPTRHPKSLEGFRRLLRALSNFIDTHTFSIDLTQDRHSDGVQWEFPRTGGGGGSGGTGFFNMDKKAIQRERKYYQYAFMVLLGIFFLTGPLVMKILGIMAAQSLLASKAALIIVGSVTLKKIFENGSSKPQVKVITLPLYDKYESEEDHDRKGYGYNQIPHRYGRHGHVRNNSPYSGYYNNERSEFAPIFYGKQKQNT
ncbi:uncharacterized protein isoform X2 [Leptinotarsa decemlineata]|uniref:uncharacterized protein isoform X2 n=1 Tax=Leptinotarsa decemlineata TaxID=7539 RepID=UPI003D30A52A